MMPLQEEVLSWIDQVWGDPLYRHQPSQSIPVMPQDNALWHQPDHLLYPALAESIRRLREKWTDAELTIHAADVYFLPMHYIPTWKEQVLNIITSTWLFEFSLPNDLLRRIEAGIVMCYTVFEKALQEVHSSPAIEAKKYFYLLNGMPDSPALFDVLERLLRGDPLAKYENGEVVLSHKVGLPRELALLTLYRLYRVGRMNQALFTASMKNDSYLIYEITRVLSDDEEYPNRHFRQYGIPAEFFAALKPYIDQMAEALATDIEADNVMLLKRFQNLTGSKWLLQAADIYQRSVSGILEWFNKANHYDVRSGVDTLVIHLAQAQLSDLDTDEKRARFVELLKSYTPSTLKALLSVTKDSHEALLAALGWEDCLPLLDQMLTISQYRALKRSNYYMVNDIPNSADPTSGLLDVPLARHVLAQAGEAHAREMMDLFRAANVGISNTIMLFEALAGWNVAKVRKSAEKRNQMAVKAYGLLPLECGEEEVLERYLFFKQYIKDSKKFGSERQANEQAAAEVGLGNLAQIAGYGDAERLEWNMESRLAVEVAPVGRQWQVEGYTVELVLDNADPQLVVMRDGKALKSIPKVLRQCADYEVMKEAKTQLQGQFRRFRAVFEQTMAAGDTLSLTDLTSLNRIPVARVLLSQLVLVTDDLITGFYLPDEMALETLSGKHVAIAQPLRIAHPYHLFHAEELALWQRTIIQRRITQPFKQAFRELYLLTPAEEDTRLYSLRFAGHTLSGAVAARLFQARHWEMLNRGEASLPKRFFRRQGVEARFAFSDVGHYFSEMPVTSDQISFHRYPNDDVYQSQKKNILPVDTVPPLIFSEIMRDADLVVSVAQREGEASISNETYQRNGELVLALLDDLGLSGVTVKGHFAYIEGKLALYRIHLGSATIHIEPGNYLCIVPSGWGQTHEKLFLPFTDTEGSKLSEVISKIFLLLADDKIKDESILAQIKRNIS